MTADVRKHDGDDIENDDDASEDKISCLIFKNIIIIIDTIRSYLDERNFFHED